MFSVKAQSTRCVAGARRAVVPRANVDRRAVFSGVLAASLAAKEAFADATPVDLFDDRKARNKGFDIIYEARDLDLTQAQRDGLSQYRGDLAATKQRYKEASKRISTQVGEYVDKAYWTLAKEELRNQVGTFRFDLRNLAASKESKEDRKMGISKAKELIIACEDLDQAIRNKDQDKAKVLYSKVTDKLSAFDKYISS